jgi:hypothetical protein
MLNKAYRKLRQWNRVRNAEDRKEIALREYEIARKMLQRLGLSEEEMDARMKPLELRVRQAAARYAMARREHARNRAPKEREA